MNAVSKTLIMIMLVAALCAPASAGPRLVYATLENSAAVTNTTTETAFNKSKDIGIDSLRAGDIVHWEAAGKHSTTGTPTLRLKFKIGTIVVADSDAVTCGSSVTDLPWQLNGKLVVRTAGSSMTGACDAQGLISTGIATTTDSLTRSAVTGNQHTQSTAQITAQWSAASESNTATLEKFLIWVEPTNAGN